MCVTVGEFRVYDGRYNGLMRVRVCMYAARHTLAYTAVYLRACLFCVAPEPLWARADRRARRIPPVLFVLRRV